MSWTIGTFFQIPVRLHWSMMLLPLLTFNLMPMAGPAGVIAWIALVVLLFGSVLLHEFGHALTARRYGIHTRDIILTPIGGMARITGFPSKPRHEIAIALAGPLVSLALAALGYAGLIASALVPLAPRAIPELFHYLGQVNLMLGLFNLVPALPMDGGRILRGVLALRRDFVTATEIAARIGRSLAIFGGLLALFYFGSWSLALISLFVYLNAGAEVRMARFREYQRQVEEQGGGGPGGPFGPFGPGPFQRPAEYRGDSWRESDADWARPRSYPPKEVLVIKGGKVKILSRSDPEDKE